MYSGRFLYIYGLLAFLLVAAVSALLLSIPGTLDDPIVKTREVPAPRLSSKSSVADARGRFSDPPEQRIDGTQIGLAEGTACDVWALGDGVSLICYQKGAS